MAELCFLIIVLTHTVEPPTESPTATPLIYSVTEYKKVLECDELKWVGDPFNEWQERHRQQFYLHLLEPHSRLLKNDEVFHVACELMKLNQEFGSLVDSKAELLNELIQEELQHTNKVPIKVPIEYNTNLQSLQYDDSPTNWAKIMACMMLEGKGKGIEEIRTYLELMGIWYGPEECAFVDSHTFSPLSRHPFSRPNPLPKEQRIRYWPALFAIANNRESAEPLLMNLMMDASIPQDIRLKAASIMFHWDKTVFRNQLIRRFDRKYQYLITLSIRSNRFLFGTTPKSWIDFFQ